MFLYNNQTKQKGFNDYVFAGPDGRMTEIHHGRSVSSKSVYSQNGSLSKKKLTVISRDGISPEFKGDYYITHNGAFMNAQSRKNSYVPIKVNQTSRNSSQNKLQHYEGLRESIIKSKIQRQISPSPMSPTNMLRLNKSISIEKNQQITSPNRRNDPQQQYKADRNIKIKNFQNGITPSIKIHPQNNHISIFSPRNDLTTCEKSTELLNFGMMESIRKQLLSTFNLKLLELQSRMQYQQETIKSLQSKISENNMKLREKERVINELLRNDRERTKSLFNINEKQTKKRDIGEGNQNYLLKRMKDIENKFRILLTEGQQLKTSQQIIDQKLTKFAYELVTLYSSKFSALKNQLGQFLQQKSYTLSTLNQSISYLDKKLIGRTQSIKELLCELKLKVKQVEDSWTQKETKTTKQSITQELRQNQDLSVNKVRSARQIQKKLKQLTTTGDDNNSAIFNSPTALQSSLEFSVTSYDADDQNRLNNIKNIYYDYNEMSDLSLGLENSLKNDFSKLTDDFYYPEGRLLPRKEESKKRFQLKGPNELLNQKVECIQKLIQAKRLILNQQIEQRQLRCYIDKTGYLKYTDSRTFVFDEKGNLIPCTEEEFRFFVAKGLIYNQKDEYDGNTAIYIQSNL